MGKEKRRRPDEGRTLESRASAAENVWRADLGLKRDKALAVIDRPANHSEYERGDVHQSVIAIVANAKPSHKLTAPGTTSWARLWSAEARRQCLLPPKKIVSVKDHSYLSGEEDAPQFHYVLRLQLLALDDEKRAQLDEEELALLHRYEAEVEFAAREAGDLPKAVRLRLARFCAGGGLSRLPVVDKTVRVDGEERCVPVGVFDPRFALTDGDDEIERVAVSAAAQYGLDVPVQRLDALGRKRGTYLKYVRVRGRGRVAALSPEFVDALAASGHTPAELRVALGKWIAIKRPELLGGKRRKSSR